MKRRATMKDVAGRAGVSISSVSHVINKTRKVEASTRALILAAIEELHYQPNTLARSLKGKGTKTIGVVIADIREDFFAEVVESIEFTASEQQYSVILCDSEDDLVKERFYLNMLISKGVDGILFAPVDMDSTYLFLVESGIPFLQIDRKIPQLESDYVGIDNMRSSAAATEHLIRTGSRKIAFIGYDDKVYTQKLRREGYRNTLAQNGSFNESYCLVVGYHLEVTTDVIKEFFSSHPDVDGAVCGTSNICYETVVALDQLGRRIPEDIRLASYDESKWFDYLKFPITVVAQPTEEIGRHAVDLIIKRVRQKKKRDFQQVILDTELIVR
jgi:LacI family transcriptional regulator